MRIHAKETLAVPGAGAYGTARVLRESQKVGKITRSCDYRYWEGRVTWDYQENKTDGTGSAKRDDNFRHLRNDRIGVQVRR